MKEARTGKAGKEGKATPTTARTAARAWAVLLACALAATALPTPPSGGAEYAIDGMSREVINLQRWKTLPGDDAAWAAPDLPDGEWKRVGKTGTLWLEDGFAV